MRKCIGIGIALFFVAFMSPEAFFQSLKSEKSFQSEIRFHSHFLLSTQALADEPSSFSFNPEVVQVSNNGTKKCMNKCHWHYVVCTTSSSKDTCKRLYKSCVKKAARRCQN